MNNLEMRIASLLKEVHANISYIISDSNHQVLASHKADVSHVAASMIKVLILETLFSRVRNSEMSLRKKISISSSPSVGGGGALQELQGSHEFSLLELARLMMVLSDNWATNLLIQFLSIEAIENRAEVLELKGTHLRRMMMDEVAQRNHVENEITAIDYTALLWRLYRLRAEEGLGEEMWKILGRQQFRDKIPFYWGEEVPFYHKTGSLDGVEHDGGIYINQKGAYSIVILASNLASNAEGIRIIGKLGKIIKEELDQL